jgi:Na+/glutamate symporter
LHAPSVKKPFRTCETAFLLRGNFFPKTLNIFQNLAIFTAVIGAAIFLELGWVGWKNKLKKNRLHFEKFFIFVKIIEKWNQ